MDFEWNTLNTIQTILIILMILSGTFYIFTNNASEHSIKNKLLTAQNMADEQCQQKHLHSSPVMSDDFKTFKSNCYAKSPYYEIPIEVRL